jgi:hypothetical protein
MKRFLIAAAVVATAMLPGIFAAQAADLEANKKTVAAFYDAVLNKKDYDLAVTFVGAAGYKQHNPTAKDGVEGMKGFSIS